MPLSVKGKSFVAIPLGDALNTAIDMTQTPELLTRAFFRASVLLGLQASDLQGYLNISLERAQALGRGAYLSADEIPLAIELIRVFERLDMWVGGDASARCLWLRSFNHAFGDIPLNLLASESGRQQVVNYLQAPQDYA